MIPFMWKSTVGKSKLQRQKVELGAREEEGTMEGWLKHMEFLFELMKMFWNWLWWWLYNCVWFPAVPWSVAHQVPLSMEFFQARILEWVAISYSRVSSQPRDQTHDSLTLRHLGSPVHVCEDTTTHWIVYFIGWIAWYVKCISKKTI